MGRGSVQIPPPLRGDNRVGPRNLAGRGRGSKFPRRLLENPKFIGILANNDPFVHQSLSSENPLLGFDSPRPVTLILTSSPRPRRPHLIGLLGRAPSSPSSSRQPPRACAIAAPCCPPCGCAALILAAPCRPFPHCSSR